MYIFLCSFDRGAVADVALQAARTHKTGLATHEWRDMNDINTIARNGAATAVKQRVNDILFLFDTLVFDCRTSTCVTGEKDFRQGCQLLKKLPPTIIISRNTKPQKKLRSKALQSQNNLLWDYNNNKVSFQQNTTIRTPCSHEINHLLSLNKTKETE